MRPIHAFPIVFLLVVHTPALAYTGPGLGLGAISVALGVVGSIFLRGRRRHLVPGETPVPRRPQILAKSRQNRRLMQVSSLRLILASLATVELFLRSGILRRCLALAKIMLCLQRVLQRRNVSDRHKKERAITALWLQSMRMTFI